MVHPQSRATASGTWAYARIEWVRTTTIDASNLLSIPKGIENSERSNAGINMLSGGLAYGHGAARIRSSCLHEDDRQPGMRFQNEPGRQQGT